MFERAKDSGRRGQLEKQTTDTARANACRCPCTTPSVVFSEDYLFRNTTTAGADVNRLSRLRMLTLCQKLNLPLTTSTRPDTAEPWKDPYMLVGGGAVEVIRPKDPAVTLPDGFRKFGWLSMLYACAPNVNFTLSWIVKFFSSCVSISK